MSRIIGADGKEYGPISAEQLRQWIAEGRANANSKILLEGTTEWKPLSAFPEFASAAQPIPPGPAVIGASPPTPGAGSDQVNGPAIGLIIVAIIGFILQAVSLVLNLVGASIMASQQMPSEAWAKMFSGAMGIIFNVLAILISGILLFAGMKMRKLESYGLCMTASILAMIPCISPCCVIGLPIGIWALVVLSKPEVKSAFH
jgi:hypothetical protein